LEIEQLDWLSMGAAYPSRLLAIQLQKNHTDRWLSDYIAAPSSPSADALLGSAMRANKHSDPSGAISAASKASRLFRQVGNQAGLLNAQFQQIYALHRLSKAQECSDQAAKILSAAEHKDYHHLTIQLRIEYSGCAAMLGNFGQARRLLEIATSHAKQHDFPVLLLRALGYEAGFESAEGRLQRSWLANETGLEQFWSGDYPSERGFQFYSDLESVAEEQDCWHLAAALESESIALLADTDRPDVEAIAHYRLANLEMTFGATASAEEEYGKSQTLFQRIPSEAPKQFYQAYADVGLANIEIANGQIQAAQARLDRAGKILQDQSNVIVQLPFLKARADLEQHLGNRSAEFRYLALAARIGNTGLESLGSARARWEWQREVGEVYRRILELETHDNHDPEQALADWELFRVRGVLDTRWFGQVATENSRAHDFLHERLKHLTTATLIVIAAFPADLTIWIADSRGVHEIHVPSDLRSIQRQINLLRVLCSDPASSLEKVNAISSRLYKLLLQPAIIQTGKNGTIFLEIDDALGLLPVSALTQTDGGLGATSLVRIPGLFYGNPSLERNPRGRFLMAYPESVKNNRGYSGLPSAQQEIDLIGDIFPDAVYLHGANLTAVNLLRELPHATMFHFAGHAINRGITGELMLNGPSLTVAEIEGLRIPKMQLVTLAACSTAANERGAETDPNGLVSAFLRAGARRVVASYWDVDSAYTTELTSAFYRMLSQGVPPETALLAARSSLHSASHPYYWASFDVFGTID